MRILIAEDNYANRNLLQRFLQAFGQVDVAVDGLDAVELYTEAMQQKKPYALLCLDIMMPKMDGLKVLRTIRQAEKQHHVSQEERIKMIMISTLTDEGYVDAAYRLGCDAYLSKPLDTKQLAEVLETLGLAEPDAEA